MDVSSLIEVQRARAFCLVGLTCVLWHQLSTVADEVRLVWRYGPLRLNSGLFLSIRYFTLLSFGIRTWSLFQLSPSSTLFVIVPRKTNSYSPNIYRCHTSALVTTISSLIIIALCDLVLLIRVWAIYRRRRSVLIFLLATFTITTAFMFFFGVRWLLGMTEHTTGLGGCVNLSRSLSHHWQIYPFTIAFNSLLLAMTAYKSIHISWNHNALVDAPWYTYTRTTMTSLLLRDGVLSYFVVLLALLFTAFGCFIQGWKLVALQSGIAPAILSIATSQLQLNLRGALANPKTRYCSCPPSYSYSSPSPSRSTLLPISFALNGFVHHATCALSSTSTIDDDDLLSSFHDTDTECVFKKFTTINDFEQEQDDAGTPECELPRTPLPAHLHESNHLEY